jgi:Sulfatase
VKQLPKICALLGIALLLSTSFVWAQSNNGSAITSGSPVSPSKGQARRPNILFIIMDDVGIDQLPAFGYGGVDPANTPNIDAIARAGVRFRNVWAMPECSPSRAVFFEGRFPLRTNVFGALLDDDLANSQVSPFEATTPKLLKRRGTIAETSANSIWAKKRIIHSMTTSSNPWDGITSMVFWRERLIRSIRQPGVSAVIPGTDKLTLAALFRIRLMGAPMQVRAASSTILVRT